VALEPDDVWVRPLHGIVLYKQFLATFPADGPSAGDTTLYARRIQRDAKGSLGVRLKLDRGRATVESSKHSDIATGSTIVAIQGRLIKNGNTATINGILSDPSVKARQTLVLVFRNPVDAGDDEGPHAPEYDAASAWYIKLGHTIEDLHAMLSVVTESVHRSATAGGDDLAPWQRFRRDI
jgi:hypothetical protein